MKKIIASLLFFLCISPAVFGAGGSSVPLLKPNNDLHDIESLRRGALIFEAKCASCHSAKYIRYSVIAHRLLWSEEEVEKLLIKGRAKFQDHMVAGMNADAAIAAFNVIPADLTLSAKVRGTDWLFTYLQAYYQTESGQTDNYVFPGSAMPNPFFGEQGLRQAMYADASEKRIIGTQSSKPYIDGKGKAIILEKEEKFEEMVRDIVNFMEFISEPQKTDRHELGMWVILFLFGLLILAVLLKKEYWKDVT